MNYGQSDRGEYERRREKFETGTNAYTGRTDPEKRKMAKKEDFRILTKFEDRRIFLLNPSFEGIRLKGAMWVVWQIEKSPFGEMVHN